MTFDFDIESRKALFNQVLPLLEEFYSNTKHRQVSSEWNIPEIKAYTQSISFDQSNTSEDVISHVIKGLDQYAVHTPHPSYYGLFNPRPNFSSIVADLITATFNPQLAAWSHSPFANEIENKVIQEFGKKFGYDSHSIDGTFCSGGAESNLTAVICALNHAFPNYNEEGILGLNKRMIIYCSSEAHHSIVKAAKATGLGTSAVRSIPVNQNLEMSIAELKDNIKRDRGNGMVPIMIVGTAGTTGAGAIDDLVSISKIAKEEKLWFHVDAAYGGAAIISKTYKSMLAGIELSDSITLDLHKWFSIPMGASLFLSRNKKILHQSFAVKADYMPEDGDPNQVIDTYAHSVQWSRRFIGFKIYLPLAIHGWEGYEKVIDRQIEMGALLKKKLQDNNWDIKNNSALPIICFNRNNKNPKYMAKLIDKINNSGKAWLSIFPIDGEDTARACITNYLTGEEELDELIELLNS